MEPKTALTIAASVVAVLISGGAVLAANFGILSRSDDLGAVAPLQETLTVDAPASTDGVETTEPYAGELVAYQIDGLGVITLLRNETRLTVDSIDVSTGWAWSDGQDVDHVGGVIVVFATADRTVNFRAWVEGGEVMVTVDEPNAAGVLENYRDDDDEEEHEEHEGEHEDD